MSEIAKPLGQLLVSTGLIDDATLREALELQRVSKCRLGEALVRTGTISEADVTQVLSNQLSVAWVSLKHVGFTPALLELVSGELAVRYSVVPVHTRSDGDTGEILYLAMDDPTDIDAMREVSAYADMRVRPLIAPPSELKRVIDRHYAVPISESTVNGSQ